jgi:hypothetical protein
MTGLGGACHGAGPVSAEKSGKQGLREGRSRGIVGSAGMVGSTAWVRAEKGGGLRQSQPAAQEWASVRPRKGSAVRLACTEARHVSKSMMGPGGPAH